ncbi:energy-coupling factor transporter transmembrane component T [Paenibacillus sp. KACC 21273]|uniref:energy-coupling factor transporter transmembrane component T n=1 Tax=Paenibacillus sp. KACC 21273 TaxID=3025665 RepID=UPI002366B98F|nr:energy-coupling factor transporter transmembrane component T [Paenibacillus sp. KACC 21273]WDF51097.1 energy-coupling factor transporter transmembrane component T [Paenibacillus sp. KACC 21273]
MNSGFRALHPITLFLFYGGLLLSGMLLFHPVFLLTGIILLIVLISIQKHAGTIVRMLPFYLLIGIAIVVINPLISHRGRHILFYFMDQPITLESVLYGVTMLLSLTLILLTSLSYNYNVTTDKFMYLFAKFVPQSALVVMMALRFVPLLRRRLTQITLVQRTRGISVHEGSLTKRMRDGMTLVKVLLVWSLEEALQSADSMKARGYGTTKRTAYVVHRMDRRDRWLTGCLSVLIIVIMIGSALGWGRAVIYPRMQSMVFSMQDWILYLCFGLYLLIPVIVEGKEWLSWKYSK